jgi:oligopeptide/dipeptide ABC transporter ATP-binding protein
VTAPLLSLRGLTLTVRGPSGTPITLVSGVDLDIPRGGHVALVGESGCGKSVTARSVLRLDPGIRVGGQILLDGEDISGFSETQLNRVRGARVGMVFQDPMSSLDPLRTIGQHLDGPLRNRGLPRRAARTEAAALLGELGVPDPERRLRSYPHEFSGGMRQRVVIALALAGQPDLLIADEPTTALDVRIQEQVLNLLADVADRRGLGVLLITHDVGIVASFADEVAVMYAGRIVEQASVHEFFASPVHPYTRALLRAVPRIDNEDRLIPLPGAPPSPARRPAGCAFHPRCELALESCSEEVPALLELGRRRWACPVVASPALPAERVL